MRVLSHAFARKVLFDAAGERATGVEVEVELADSGALRVLRLTATREVVLCAGAINTPQLLMLPETFSAIEDRLAALDATLRVSAMKLMLLGCPLPLP